MQNLSNCAFAVRGGCYLANTLIIHTCERDECANVDLFIGGDDAAEYKFPTDLGVSLSGLRRLTIKLSAGDGFT